MTEEAEKNIDTLIELTADVVSAYVSNNPIPVGDLPALIGQVHAALKGTAGGVSAEEPVALTPAVPIRKSVTPDYIISLEDGKKFKSLKRHLSTHYGLTPDGYRAKMGPAGGLSHGRAELRRGALVIGQDDGARPQTESAGSAGAGADEANPQEGRGLISAIELRSGALQPSG